MLGACDSAIWLMSPTTFFFFFFLETDLFKKIFIIYLGALGLS